MVKLKISAMDYYAHRRGYNQADRIRDAVANREELYPEPAQGKLAILWYHLQPGARLSLLLLQLDGDKALG